MRIGPRLSGLALGAVLLVSGCAVISSEAARQQVQADVEARLGATMALGSEGQARWEVSAMLEDGLLEADEAVRLAVANNQKLRAFLEDLDIARAELWDASLPPNPVGDIEVRFAEAGGGEFLELGVAQSIIDILLIPRRRQVAAERFEEVRAEVTAAVLDLATEVRAAYRGLQAQMELVELLRTAMDTTYLSYDAARRLRDAGNIIELEVLQEQALFEDAKIALVETQTSVRRHRENLNVLLGIWGPEGEAWKVEPRLPLPEALDVTAPALEQRVLAASLDLSAMQHRIMAFGHEVGLRRLHVMFPAGDLGAKAEREADGEWSAGPLLSFSIPVFNHGQGASAEVRARLEQAYERYTDLAVRIRRSARSAYVESEASGHNSRYLRDVVIPLRTRITAQTHRQFNAMQSGVFQLLEARRREIDAGRSYVETLRDHWIARTRLEALLLGRLPERRFGILAPDVDSHRARATDENSRGHR